MLWGRVDTDGHVIGRYHQTVTDNLTTMLIGQVRKNDIYTKKLIKTRQLTNHTAAEFHSK